MGDICILYGDRGGIRVPCSSMDKTELKSDDVEILSGDVMKVIERYQQLVKCEEGTVPSLWGKCIELVDNK